MKSNILSLGIEFGSTRIKAVLIDEKGTVISQGNHEWENNLIDGYWTYSLEDIWSGVQSAYAELANVYKSKTGEILNKIDSIGISAMMHGYLAFDSNGGLLVPFRTWRNVNTDDASKKLSELFKFNIPHRWSVAHIYQAILNEEKHVADLDFVTTLAGYVHWQLTGEKVLGIGDAAGMFPINDESKSYDVCMLDKFNNLSEVSALNIKLENLLPSILLAGEEAGKLSEKGARLLDPSGNLAAGALLCPPEGDAGTGMTATNTISSRTGNVSAGTSIFAMIVLEKSLKNYYPEIDMVTTPDGKPVAMVHCNNGTPETDAWMKMFGELIFLMGYEVDINELYKKVYTAALEGDGDCSGIVSVNYLAGEPIAKVSEGRPMYIRKADSKLNLANFMLSQLYSIVTTLRMGMDILVHEENVLIDELLGHGGIFKTKAVMQSIMASALDVPLAVYESAGEGGAWGIALLASYSLNNEGESLDEFLNRNVFSDSYEKSLLEPEQKIKDGFNNYLENYKQVLELERSSEGLY